MSFKEYRSKKHHHHRLPTLETIFGSHALEEKAVDAGAKKLMEGTFPKVSSAESDFLHDYVAPMNDKDITEDEKFALKKYTAYSFTSNSTLHHHYAHGFIPANEPDRANSIHTNEHLDSLMNRQETTNDMVVYTGIKKSPASQVSPDKPTKVHLPAFTSTSTMPMIAHGFCTSKTTTNKDHAHGVFGDESGVAKHMLKIHLPKGTKAASLVNHSILEEHEVLLHRGHNIVIHPNPEKIGINTYMWNAHIDSHTPEEIRKDVP